MFDHLPPHNDVFILGAGFSRAVSDRMPLTDELGNACLKFNGLQDAQGVPPEFKGGRFETWLSSIAEPQPYLPEPSNLENQVLFVKFSDAIGQVLGSCVHDVLSNPPARWLAKFVTATHVRQATVITFNYDTLVECAVSHRKIWQPDLTEPVAWTEVTGDVPGWPAGAIRWGAELVDTFRLLKLHGSLNWFWTPGDATGLSVARRLLPGTFEASEPYTEEDRRRQLPARVPFVVPPSATKSSYYQNRLVRELWIQAGEALTAASHVSLIGYSLPITDLTVSSMLNTTLGGSKVPVHVVDVTPDDIVGRLRALDIESFAEIGSDTAAEDHVTQYCEAISRELIADLQRTPAKFSEAPVLVVWGHEEYSVVVSSDATNGALRLTVEDPALFDRAVQSRSGTALPTLAQLLATTPSGGYWTVVVPGKQDTELLFRVDRVHDVGFGVGQWNVFLPSAGYPD